VRRSLWSRVRRWHLFAILCIIATAVIAMALDGQTIRDALPAVGRAKPPVGAYSFKRSGDEADFNMETEVGRFGLKVGSRSFEDLPYGMPLYPGSRLVTSARMDSAMPGEEGRLARFLTNDPPAKVVDFYRRLAQASKFMIVTDSNLDGIHILTCKHPSRGDGGFQLMVTRDVRGSSEATMTTGFGMDVDNVAQPDPEALNALLTANIMQESAANGVVPPF